MKSPAHTPGQRETAGPLRVLQKCEQDSRPAAKGRSANIRHRLKPRAFLRLPVAWQVAAGAALPFRPVSDSIA
jgi:hypothetical protein